MDVLITGINGFIGGSYAARLRSTGASRITGIDIQPAPAIPDRCDRYPTLDLGRPEAAETLDRLPRFDAVLHAGGISGFMVESGNPQRIFDVNVAGTLAILETARRERTRRVVLCSSIMVYGPDDGNSPPHDEAEYPVPVSVYGASKLAQEGLMSGYVGEYGVDAIALRFAHVYGPGRTTECFVREMLAAAIAGHSCSIPQAARSLRQYVYISDVLHAIDLAIGIHAPPWRIFNISADELQTLGETAGSIRQLAGGLDVAFDESVDLPNYRIGKLSIRRAREVLGYRPRVPLQEGLQDYRGIISKAARSR